MAARPSVLITGAAGGLAKVVAEMLAKEYNVYGVDPRAPENKEFPGEYYGIDYRKREMAEIFRSKKFTTLVHMGRIPIMAKARKAERYNLNVLGTRNLLDLAKKYSVKNVLVLNSYHVYGAHQHNHLHITEDDPLRASQTFTELSDIVELDNVSVNFLLRHPEVKTVILRAVNIVGPRIRNSISMLLRRPVCPVLLGYDPIQQFISEHDMARAIRMAIEGNHKGVYNVAGEGVIPFSKAVEVAGAKPVPIPHFLGYPLAGLLAGVGVQFPRHLLDYFRYPTVISDEAFRRDYGYKPEVSTIDALKSLRQSDPS